MVTVTVLDGPVETWSSSTFTYANPDDDLVVDYIAAVAGKMAGKLLSKERDDDAELTLDLGDEDAAA
jgi:hypothetical protein